SPINTAQGELIVTKGLVSCQYQPPLYIQPLGSGIRAYLKRVANGIFIKNLVILEHLSHLDSFSFLTFHPILGEITAGLENNDVFEWNTLVRNTNLILPVFQQAQWRDHKNGFLL